MELACQGHMDSKMKWEEKNLETKSQKQEAPAKDGKVYTRQYMGEKNKKRPQSPNHYFPSRIQQECW